MSEKQEEEAPEEEYCAGYQRSPHIAKIVLNRQYPDGHKDGLCRSCADAWLASEDPWPPPKSAIPNSLA